MKKILLFVLVFAFLFVGLTACVPLAEEAPPPTATAEEGANNALIQTLVDLPNNVELGITSVIVWAVSWFFVQLVTLAPFLKFLVDFKQPIALALAGQLIALIENAMPDAFGGIAVAGLVLLLTILAFFKVGEILEWYGVRGFS